LIEISWSRTLGHQVCIQEGKVSDLVIGVVVDVLREVRVKVLKLGSVGRISTPVRHLFVLDSSEFVVLHPKIAFQDLGCSRKSEQSGVSLAESALRIVSQQPPSNTCRASGR
jgi:hypothetical protein